MKKIRLLIPALLLIGLTLCATPVLADDPSSGLDVDIAVIGDDADVNVDIVGDNSNVTINGEVPFVTYHSRSTNRWAKNTIKEDILPWMEYTEDLVILNMDGLAKVILLAQNNEVKLADLENLRPQYTSRLDSNDNQLSVFNSKLAGAETELDALNYKIATLDTQVAWLTAKDAYLWGSLLYYRNIIMGLIMGLVAVGIVLGVHLKRRAY